MSRARIGVVLAGGLATRMGGDKAGARLGELTLLANAVATVTAAGLEPRVCARASTVLPEVQGLSRCAVWREPEPAPGQENHAHPLSGLAYAAAQAGEPIVALPVDLPLLPPAVLTQLACQQMPLAVLGSGGRPAALVARVGPAHAPLLADAAAAGAPALRTLVALGAAVLELADLAPGTDPDQALTNVNRAEDLLGLRPALRPPRAP